MKRNPRNNDQRIHRGNLLSEIGNSSDSTQGLEPLTLWLGSYGLICTLPFNIFFSTGDIPIDFRRNRITEISDFLTIIMHDNH
jgi:hypothetical protein